MFMKNVLSRVPGPHRHVNSDRAIAQLSRLAAPASCDASSLGACMTAMTAQALMQIAEPFAAMSQPNPQGARSKAMSLIAASKA